MGVCVGSSMLVSLTKDIYPEREPYAPQFLKKEALPRRADQLRRQKTVPERQESGGLQKKSSGPN
jgi:hypothetical protein